MLGLKRRLLPLALAPLLFAGASGAAEPDKTRQNGPAIEPAIADASAYIAKGWSESIISVRDRAEMVTFFEQVLGWEQRASGDVSREQLTTWGLAEEASATFTLVANPNSETGFVRILQFDGVDQRRAREHDQAWETGGIYNINIRIADIADIAGQATARGWQAPSAPVRFTFGPFMVWEWIPRHADGVRIAFSQRVARL